MVLPRATHTSKAPGKAGGLLTLAPRINNQWIVSHPRIRREHVDILAVFDRRLGNIRHVLTDGSYIRRVDIGDEKVPIGELGFYAETTFGAGFR